MKRIAPNGLVKIVCASFLLLQTPLIATAASKPGSLDVAFPSVLALPSPTKLPAVAVPDAAQALSVSIDPAGAAVSGPVATATAEQLAAAVSPAAGQLTGGEAAQRASRAAFDGAAAGVSVGGAGAGSPPGGGRMGGGAGDGFSGGGSLGRSYPRVIMILDPLTGPASDKLVSRIEALADRGARVVFVTPRPDKGPNSAHDVLISKLRVRANKNPVIVVSYNGARVHVHNSRAENRRPLLEDEPGFAPNTIKAFREIGASVMASFKKRGALQEFSLPHDGDAHIYGIDLPKDADAPQWALRFNKALRQAGFQYKVEPAQRADGHWYLFTQSTALRLNTGRIFKAIEAQYPDLKETLKPGEVLILGDSRKTARFLATLKGAGYMIHGVTGGQSLEEALGAVLGHESLEKVSVLRSQLRSYAEWLDKLERYGSAGMAAGGGYGGRIAPKKTRNDRDLKFYRGIIMYDLMGRLYHSMRKGQYEEASPEAAVDLLERMWRYPLANGVRISPELEAARHRWASWESTGFLNTSKQWLRNYYSRNFKDYPHNVGERVVGTMINLARDTKNTITVQYASPYTGRRYLVHVLPARMNLERDDKGYILVADVYRTGAEPYQADFEDSVETSLVAKAALVGYASFHDGRWWVNNEPDPRVEVRFHYMTRDLSVTQTPEQIEARSTEVTAFIEKMHSDEKFLEHWAEQEKRNNKSTSRSQKLADKRAARRAEKQKLKPRSDAGKKKGAKK